MYLVSPHCRCQKPRSKPITRHTCSTIPSQLRKTDDLVNRAIEIFPSHAKQAKEFAF